MCPLIQPGALRILICFSAKDQAHSKSLNISTIKSSFRSHQKSTFKLILACLTYYFVERILAVERIFPLSPS